MRVNVLNDIPYLSASRIKLFEKCKFQFYKQYIEGLHEEKEESVDVEEALHFTFGTIVHGAIEDFWTKKEGRKKSDLIRHYENRCVEHGLTDQYYFELGFELLEDYFSYLVNDAPNRKHIASELSFDFKLGGARLTGRIDDIFYRGNGVYEIVDYKTNNWLPTQDEIDADIQLGIYDIAFREDEELKKYWVDGKEPKAILLTMHFLKHYPMHTEYTKHEREMNKRYLQVVYRQMQLFKKEQFAPSLNRFCTYCDFPNECPAYQEALNNDSLDFIKDFDEDEFVDNLALEEELKSRIKILDAKLCEVKENMVESFKSSVGSDESIVIGDREYFLNQTSRRYINKGKAIAILKKADLWEPEAFIGSLSISKVQALTEDDEDVWFKIERKAMGVSPSEPVLKSRKIKRT